MLFCIRAYPQAAASAVRAANDVQADVKKTQGRVDGMFDPVTGIHVELGTSGAFNLRVDDARRLLIRVVGTSSG